MISSKFRKYVVLAVTVANFSSMSVAATPRDNDVAAKVDEELKRNDALSREKFKVTNESGVLTLSGQVETLGAKRRAVEVAKHVRGVKSVIDQILLRPRQLDDKTIAACVRRALVVDPVTEKFEIVVSVNDGKVGLAGKVSSLTEKRVAENVVEEIDGVADIFNQLTVTFTGQRPDTELQAEVQSLIDNDVSLVGSRVSANISDGVAKLSGTVATAWQKDRCLQLASLPGIERVTVEAVRIDSTMPIPQLDRSATIDDAQVRDAIILALRFDPLTLSYTEDVNVQVKRGNVDLKGIVGRVRAKQAAEQVAKNTVGVRHVTNNLKVSWAGEEVDDATIIAEAQAAIQRSAYLQGHEIRVHCRDAHLHLYGLVDSEFEKRRATWTCDGLKGVVHVGNMLAVAPEWKSKPDLEIKADLQSKLKQSLIFTDTPIDVSVRNGVAILHGNVDSWQQWQAALEIALEAGARVPHNLIRVHGHPSHNGRELFVP